ncbi:adenine-specific DNA-methyltransferase [Butyrivibrio sp. INlla18]|uniref:site-specific DNA-methyltransferase n=1 Tax=Butyrivibrio sp. INlla18 TaxID=1520806 RepID=UPI0008869455|nr:site-specific DNA-methyltransferase [Butyrivibrio sp. INlla18]SDA39057.1 adenine-specific DNA-methyltransferase [Butyrivibrio sp. INlla18]
MAAIHELIRQVNDPALRARLEQEVERLTEHKKFGLVFEEHLPECTPLYGLPIKRGSTVARKGSIGDTYVVLKKTDTEAVCRNKISGENEVINLDELVVTAEFGEPIFPTLTPIDRVENAPENSLWHTLIQADNYHALQLLEYVCANQVDCIYIDPPYNTDHDEWKYNDAFVDSNDRWAHSMWLSMMKKRLVLAQRLLTNAGVLIISIGYQELNRLVLLCEELFPERQIVTVTVQTSGGKPSGGFNYLQEYLVFVTPLNFSGKAMDFVGGKKNAPFHGMTLATFSQEERPNQVYPIFVEKKTGKIIGCGKSLQELVEDGTYKGDLADFVYHTDEVPDGATAVWPISQKGLQCVWRLIPTRFLGDVKKGHINVIKQTPGKNSNEFGIQYLSAGIIKKINSGEIVPKGRDKINGTYILDAYESEGSDIPTIWNEKEFYTTKGSGQIDSIFGSKEFPYPKPLTLITEVLRACTDENSLILDFFAGSGTTLNAVNLLNDQDGGNRRCIIVTNNEISKKQYRAFTKAGMVPGSIEWEKHGICRSVTWPRTVATITGKRPDGSDIPGKYFAFDEENNNRPMAQGFKSNCEYFKLDFLDRDQVSLGTQFKEILPMLWMKAGAIGKRPEVVTEEPDMLILPENCFAVLVKESAYAAFASEVKKYDSIEMVFFVTNSESAFHDMSEDIGIKNTYQLYRDYIDNFVIGGRRART